MYIFFFQDLQLLKFWETHLTYFITVRLEGQLPIHINKISFSDYIIFLFFLQIGLCSFLWQQSLKRGRKVIGEISANPISQKKKRYDRMPGYFHVRLIRHVKSSFCLVLMEDMLDVLSKYCKFSPRKEEENSLKTFHLNSLLKPKSLLLCFNASIAYTVLAWGGQAVGLDDLCRSLTNEKTLFYTISSDMQHLLVLELWCSIVETSRNKTFKTVLLFYWRNKKVH